MGLSNQGWGLESDCGTPADFFDDYTAIALIINKASRLNLTQNCPPKGALELGLRLRLGTVSGIRISPYSELAGDRRTCWATIEAGQSGVGSSTRQVTPMRACQHRASLSLD